MYHGTIAENAENILKDGFNAGTFFSKHLEDALHMGGDYIFEVYFAESPTEYWEYITDKSVPSSNIRSHYKFQISLLWDNEECSNKISRRLVEERDDDSVFCEACNGKGQKEYYPPFTRWTGNEKITFCEECGGFGYTK